MKNSPAHHILGVGVRVLVKDWFIHIQSILVLIGEAGDKDKMLSLHDVGNHYSMVHQQRSDGREGDVVACVHTVVRPANVFRVDVENSTLNQSTPCDD